MIEETPRRKVQAGEEGYILLIAIFLLALFVISLAVAAPQIAREIQRDREIETMHRGMQYRRAVQLYFRKFNAYPPNLDALVKTNNIRFLRKKYIDPTTGKEEWKAIRFGQNKVPTAMGFFGQPLSGSGSTLAGTGPVGGNGGIGNGSGFGSGSGGSSSGFGGASGGIGSSSGPGSIFGSNSGSTSSTGSGSGSAGSSTSGSSTDSSSSGLTGQTFGGGGIIGFSPTSSRQSILMYKKKNHYNEWEFTYDPISDRPMMPGGTGSNGLNPATGNSNSITGGGAFGGPTSGSSSGFGGQPTPQSPTTTGSGFPQ